MSRELRSQPCVADEAVSQKGEAGIGALGCWSNGVKTPIPDYPNAFFSQVSSVKQPATSEAWWSFRNPKSEIGRLIAHGSRLIAAL